MIGLARKTGGDGAKPHPLGTEATVGHVDRSAGDPGVRTQIGLTVLAVRKGTQEELTANGLEVDKRPKGSNRVSRQTAEATVHEEWQAASAGGGDKTLTFRTPPEGPYSYEGDCVSYAWRVSARAVRTMRPDARLDQPSWVEP